MLTHTYAKKKKKEEGQKLSLIELGGLDKGQAKVPGMISLK